MQRDTRTDTHSDTHVHRQMQNPPETTQGSFKVGRGAKGGLLVLAVVSLQSLIPPDQLLIPAFLQPPHSSLRLDRALSTQHSALSTGDCNLSHVESA